MLQGVGVSVIDLDALEQASGAARLQAIVEASAERAVVRVTTVAKRQHCVLHRRQILRVVGTPGALGGLRMVGRIAFAGGADDAQQPRHACELTAIDGFDRQRMRADAGRLQRGNAALRQLTRKSGLACPDDQHAAGVCALCADTLAGTQQYDRAQAQIHCQAERCQLPAMRRGWAPPCALMQAGQPADDDRKRQQSQPVAQPHA